MTIASAVARAVFGAVETITGTSPIGTVRLSPADLAYAERTLTLTSDRDAAYQTFQGYYDGQQADPRDVDSGIARGTGRTFTAQHNFCAVAIDAMVERLQLVGVGVAGDALSEEQGPEIEAQLWQWWQANRMDATQTTTHAQALVKGDAFLLCDYDAANNRPRWTFYDALRITPVYDAYHRITAAYQVWSETAEDGSIRRRLTVYRPSMIEKWFQQGRGWELWTADTDSNGQPDGGVVAWVDRAGQPLGVPLVHFTNKPRGSDFGRSELADVLPLQDEYNRRVWNTSEAMSFAGNLQKYVIDGNPPPRKADGSDGAFVSGPGVVWKIASANAAQRPAQVGFIPPTDIAALQDATDRELKTLAAQTGTPLHLIWPDGALPSGEALKTAEARFVAKIRDRAVTFGNCHEDAFLLAIRLHNTFGTGDPIPEDITLSAQWDSFETRSALADAQVTQLRGADWSLRERLRRDGMDGEQIDRIISEKEQEQNPATALADAFAARMLPDATAQQQGGATA